MVFLRNKTTLSSFFWAIFYALIFLVALKNSFSYLDPDFGWHLEVGETIVREKAVPTANIYNFSYSGNWVDHEWLSNAAISIVYNHLGYIFLSCLFAFLIVAIFFLLHFFCKRRFAWLPDWLSAVIQSFAIIASMPHFGVRIQEFGLLFLLLLLAVLEIFLQRKKILFLFWIIPIMYFWSAIHGSFLLGFLLLGFFIAVKSIERIISVRPSLKWPVNFSQSLNWRELAIISGISILAFLTTLLGPYGSELYSFLFGYKDSYYLSHIQEWLPQSSFPFFYWQLGYLVLVALSLIHMAYSCRREGKKLDLWQFALGVLFFIMAFKSRRHFPLLTVATFPLVVMAMGDLFYLKKRPSSERADYYVSIVGITVIIAMILSAIMIAVNVQYSSRPFSAYCEKYPCAAVDFLRQHKEYDDLKLFNSYAWGGFMIKELPERKLFIDGRLPQVSYQGHSFLEEYYEFFSDDSKIAAKLEEHEIGLILVTARDEGVKAARWEKFFFGLSDDELRANNNLRKYLVSSEDWREEYRDGVSVIYRNISR